MKKLFDPKFVGKLSLLLLLISFIDVLFITDARSFIDMTSWGKISFLGFIISIGWMAIFMFIIPLTIKIFKK